uniref:ceramidase n=1 Tax=Strombidium inclinatum TaxID=197538 RepID=A0A7S3IXY1_9SPIT|mmetsp:Transcript_8601/g.13317  ORF Transcript_8601/g.13317 Transcript_8601/m.13317 type:complete len:241 (+) Transcript_8601:529-1251(+)
MFSPVIGVYTGIRPGAFSLSVNLRGPRDHKIGLVENLIMTFAGYRELSWLTREALTECDSFDCAYHKIRDTPISALGYVILAGTEGDEGVVVTRNRLSVAHENHLNATAGKWYVVQTNNDHWDSGCFNRCAAATDHMESVGQENISPAALRHDVEEQFPNLNYITIYNSQLVPSAGYIDTVAEKYEGEQPEAEKKYKWHEGLPRDPIDESLFEGLDDFTMDDLIGGVQMLIEEAVAHFEG